MEIATIGILSFLLGIQLRFDMIYSGRIRQFDEAMTTIDNQFTADEEYAEDEIHDCARMYAQAKIDRSSNRYAISICVVGITGLVVMHLLNMAELVAAVGWMSFIIVPLPVYLFVYHIRTIVRPFEWERQSLMDMH